MSINRVTISGNLGRDPELRATASGTQVCSLAVCVNTRQKVNGEWSDKANWVDVIFFGNRAESIAKYLAKGSHVTIAGRLSQNTWETKEGQKRSSLRSSARTSTSKAASARGRPQRISPQTSTTTTARSRRRP